jgi:hypothetical protein
MIDDLKSLLRRANLDLGCTIEFILGAVVPERPEDGLYGSFANAIALRVVGWTGLVSEMELVAISVTAFNMTLLNIATVADSFIIACCAAWVLLLYLTVKVLISVV